MKPSRTLRIAGQIVVLLTVAVISLATSFPPSQQRCFFGGSPFPSQTNFAVDAPILVIGPAIDDDAPTLADSVITLEQIDANGARIPVPIRVEHTATRDNGHRVWRVRPKVKLKKNKRYVLTGLDYLQLKSAYYDASDPTFTSISRSWLSRRSFLTGSAPRLLSALTRIGQKSGEAHVTLIFSEPMELSSLQNQRIRVVHVGRKTATFNSDAGATSTDAGGGATDSTTLLPLIGDVRSIAGQSNMFEITIDITQLEASQVVPALLIKLDAAVRGQSGAGLQGYGMLGDTSAQTSLFAPSRPMFDQVPRAVFEGDSACAR